MKAIILASGAGKRLGPLTGKVPKSLVDIGDGTILDRQLDILIRQGITDIVITTGSLGEQIEEHVRGAYSIAVDFVHNPRFETTNYIYTLWLTREMVDDDVILLHGDLVFDDEVVRRLLDSEGSRVLISKDIPSPEKDFKALVKDDRVMKIGVDLYGANTFFCAPMYKFSRSDFLCWLDKIDEFISRGDVHSYAEDALNEVSDRVSLRPSYFYEFCMEIDTIDDFESVRAWITK